jgi:hypothetical protein
VKERFKLFIKCVTLAFFLGAATLHAQVLKDTVSLTLIKKCVDYTYDFQFNNAYEVCNEIDQSYPGHPVVSLLRGMIIYWENYPLLPTSPASVSFENEMHNCIRICEKRIDGDDEGENLLINLCTRCMLLLYYTDNDLTTEIFPLSMSTYQYLRRSFHFTSVYSDFYFFTGLYNYYREAYPEAYPVYKALAFLFPKGNKTKGLKELQAAANNSIFLKADSFSFLSGICISFEDDYQKAYYYSSSNSKLYPGNIQYLAMYIKNLLLLKHYDEAEELVKSSGKQISNTFYQAQLAIFNGILQEKKYHNYEQAQEFYKNGVLDISHFAGYGNDFAAYAYFGLSRISDLNGDKRAKKTYHKKALELADFKKVNFDE